MTTQESSNIDRIARAIEYISAHAAAQPDLEDVARQVHLSPFHFQRLFTEYTGLSPKKFLQYCTLDHARALLQQQGATLFDAAIETGLSGTGRLHHLFVTMEAMTPGTFKSGGSGLDIRYGFAATPFGPVLLATTPVGLCHLVFIGEREESVTALKMKFPAATFAEDPSLSAHPALAWFRPGAEVQPLHLHLKGSPFQLKVWEALLQIPEGSVSTYQRIAAATGHTDAVRAAGTAIGANPVACLIPCHRVLRTSGAAGGYRWGLERKQALLAWEKGHQEVGRALNQYPENLIP